jgi:hypothetical protein
LAIAKHKVKLGDAIAKDGEARKMAHAFWDRSVHPTGRVGSNAEVS